MYVLDAERQKVLVFTPSGEPLAELGVAALLPGELPLAVAHDSGEKLYVLGQSGIAQLRLEDTPSAARLDPLARMRPVGALALIGALTGLLIVALRSHRVRAARLRIRAKAASMLATRTRPTPEAERRLEAAPKTLGVAMRRGHVHCLRRAHPQLPAVQQPADGRSAVLLAEHHQPGSGPRPRARQQLREPR